MAKINDLPEREKRDFEKAYTFDDLRTELNNFKNGTPYANKDNIFLAYKIVELTNEIQALKQKINND